MEVGWLVQRSPEDRVSVLEQRDLRGNSGLTEISDLFQCCQDPSMKSILLIINYLLPSLELTLHALLSMWMVAFTTPVRFCFITRGLISVEAVGTKIIIVIMFLILTYSSSCVWEKAIFTKPP